LIEEKKVDLTKVNVFATTPPYYDYNWTVRGNLDPALIKKLTEAFLKLDPAESRTRRDPQAAARVPLHRDQT